MASEKLSLTILKICSANLCLEDSTLVVPEQEEEGILAVMRNARRFFLMKRVLEPTSDAIYLPQQAQLIGIEPTGKPLIETHPLHPKALGTTSGNFRREFEGTLSRYSAAHKAGKAVTDKSKRDALVLSLNEAIWGLKLVGPTATAFPDSGTPWQVEPMDPALLRCVQTDTVEDMRLKSVLITGMNSLDIPTTDLLGGPLMHDATIFLDGDHPQVLARISDEDAQRIGVRRMRLTCKIQVRNGGKPEITGDFTLE